ncbi:MAG: V-type ATP synthase subunit D [Elusimicrobiota bacterium]
MANVLNVNPNRMELMKLRDRLSLARRGHRLLKDKQDDLMKRFTETTEKVRELRSKIEDQYDSLKIPYLIIRSVSEDRGFISYCKKALIKADIWGVRKHLMNLVVPKIKVEFEDNTQNAGNLNVSSLLPGFIKKFLNLTRDVVKLGNEEKKMYLLAEELEKVRRRVNALEYIFIPKLEETVDYISMQLEELERENITRLMKIKDIVRDR